MTEEKSFFRKHWSNVLFFIFIVLILIPQTRQPIRIFLNEMIAFSPSEIDEEDREKVTDFDWRLRDVNNQTVNFEVSQGQPILVNYWATWCAPCIAEMPDLQLLYNDYKDNVDFYFVTSESKEVVDMFMEKRGFTLPVYYAGSQPPQIMRSSSLPTTFLISSQGEIVMKKIGVAKWNSETVRRTIDKLK